MGKCVCIFLPYKYLWKVEKHYFIHAGNIKLKQWFHEFYCNKKKT